jgi:hypothetical protein
MLAGWNSGRQGFNEVENASLRGCESDGAKNRSHGEHPSQKFHHWNEQMAGRKCRAGTSPSGNGEPHAEWQPNPPSRNYAPE